MEHPTGRPLAREWPIWALVPIVAAIYFLAAKLGLTMAFVAAQVTPVWPPTGIALAAVLLLGTRVWPGIALGAFAANLTANEPLIAACGIGLGNTLEALAGAALLRRVGFEPSLQSLRDVRAIIISGALLSTAVAATIGVATLCVTGVQSWAAFGSLWWIWWFGDMTGALVVAPLLLVWGRSKPIRWHARRLVEAVGLTLAAVVLGLGLFAGTWGLALAEYPIHYLIFPLVIWAAVRFRQPGATTMTALVSGLAIWGTAHGFGPFVMSSVHVSLVMLQLFMAVVAVTGLLVAAAIGERDRSERARMVDYARLEDGEQRLRLALEAGRMGVWDWNIATGEVKWSDNLEAIHGLAPGSFPGTFDGFRALIHPDDRTRVDEALAGAVTDGSGYEIEFRNVWPDGSVHWMSAKGRVFRDRAGMPIRMVGVGMDSTTHKRLEEELQGRTTQLEQADRRKDEFLAMLAHELRNPLAPLRNVLHLLRLDVAGRGRFVEIADRQLTHLVRLVDDLLDVSRITQGKIALRREPVALADVVGRAVEMMRALVDARGHALTVSLPAEPLRIDADPARLAQVLGNLLSNAVKYTPPGGSIWLTAARVDAEVAIRVRDTGIGLAPALLPHIFDVFVQGDASLDRTRGGLGIGLTLVRRLVELHGGRVEALSAGPGHGSEFVVWLPVLGSGLPEVALPPPAGAAQAKGRRLKVLVVEDSQDTAESLMMLLDLWGYEARVAFDGPAALEVAEQLVPDVILSDVGLPGMDGYELARRLRQHPRFGRAVLIALSGYGQEEDKRRALDAGFDHHLVKPPNLAELADLLERVVVREAEGRPQTLH